MYLKSTITGRGHVKCQDMAQVGLFPIYYHETRKTATPRNRTARDPQPRARVWVATGSDPIPDPFQEARKNRGISMVNDYIILLLHSVSLLIIYFLV